MFTESPIETSSHDLSNSSSTKSFSMNDVKSAIDRAQQKLISLQNDAGYWVFELEADCTIPAEYIMMMHYLDDINEE